MAFTPSIIDSLCGKNRVSAEAILLGLIRTYRNRGAADLAEIILSEAEENSPGMLADRSVLAACLDAVDALGFASVAQAGQGRMRGEPALV